MIKVPVSLSQTSSKKYGPQEPVSNSWHPCWLSDSFRLLPIKCHFLGVLSRVFTGPGLALLGPNASRPGRLTANCESRTVLLHQKTSALRHCGINSSSVDCQFNTPNKCNRMEIRFLATLRPPSPKDTGSPTKTKALSFMGPSSRSSITLISAVWIRKLPAVWNLDE